MNNIGIMQGRLTPKANHPIQFFPFENWESEFYQAAEIGIHEIEYIFDYDRFQENPLWSREGRNKILAIIRQTNVRVNFLCADYFMVKPFFRCAQRQYQENISILKSLIDWSCDLGFKGIEIPLVDNSSIKTTEENITIIQLLQLIIPLLEKKSISINLETDLNPKAFKEVLEYFSHPLIRANYDTGNSSGIGYNPAEEISAYGSFIGNIHIKDRLLGNGTVELGNGSAQFNVFFSELAKVGYSGSFILQAARGDDGNEKEWIKKQMQFVQSYFDRYLF
jgi:L-ribulose-5-phosphate 3-epimerase